MLNVLFFRFYFYQRRFLSIHFSSSYLQMNLHFLKIVDYPKLYICGKKATGKKCFQQCNSRVLIIICVHTDESMKVLLLLKNHSIPGHWEFIFCLKNEYFA